MKREINKNKIEIKDKLSLYGLRFIFSFFIKKKLKMLLFNIIYIQHNQNGKFNKTNCTR